MKKIAQDLDLSTPNTLDELYNIHFIFTDGKYRARNLQNIIAWDTESSNGFRIPDSNTVIGFEQDKYDRGILKTHDVPKDKIDYEDEDVKYMMLIDECEPVGIIYMWQVAIEDGEGGIYKYIGRDWDDYLNFQLKLTQEIKRQAAFGFKCINREYENKKADKLRLNINMSIYTHNLGHDMQMLRSLYNESFVNAKNTRVFARKPRKPMKASMRLNDVTITYKDTLVLTQKSLRAWAHDCPNIPIEKVDDFDYLTIKTPKDKLTDLVEIKYGIHDVAIIVYGMEYEREIVGGKLEDICITQTGKVRRVLEKNVCARNPYWAYTCAYITRSYSPEEYRKRIALYQGGYTHGCAQHVGKVGTVHMYDFASSYPSSLTTGYYPTEGYEPCDVSEFDELAKQDVERPQYRWFAKIRLHNVRPKLSHSYWSESKCVELDNFMVDNGRIRRAELMTIWATDLDWETFTHAYVWDSMKVLELEKGKAALLPREMIETILDYYGKKTLLKGEKDKESEYITSKEFCNSIYGNFVYKLVSDQVYFDGDWETRRLDDEGDPMFYELITQVSDTKANGFFDLGLICSAIARHRLWEFIIKFDSKCWYMDTDSVKGTFDEDDRKWIEDYNKWIEDMENEVAKTIQIDPDRFCPKTSKGVPKRLGIMEYEGEAKLKFLGAKRYITEENGEIECTIAGLPKKAGTDKIKSFDDFNNHTLWTTAESHKVCCYYNDNQPERMEWTGRDGEIYFSNDKYGVCLKPVTFDLSMSDEFVTFLNLLFTGAIENNNITEPMVPKYLLK